MKDFFINLETPTLNSNYANSLNELVVNINQNFAKIASLPFLKGDSGVSIEVCDEVFYSDDEEFTPFACAVINAIYGGDIPEDEYKIDGHSSYEDLKNIKTIPVFYDKSQGKKYLTVPFMFHDARKNYLGEVINTEHSMNFVDMSTFVLGSGIYNGTEWVWDMSKHDFEPKLYFNSNTQKFCWAIGSQKTDIIAQGVEGQPGASVYAKYCQGILPENDHTYIQITSILNDGELQGNEEADFNTNINEHLSDGDFVIVELTSPHADLAFGKVMTVGGVKCIPYFENTTLYGAVNNITLKELLNRVGKSVNTELDNVRGLYVYEKNEQTAKTDGTSRKPHMFWVDNNEGHLGMLKSEEDTIKNEPELGTNGVLNLDYDKTKAKVIDADLYTHVGDDPKILSYGQDKADKFELQQSPVDSGVSSGVICFVPNPKVVYKEPSALFNTAATQIDFGSTDSGSTGSSGSGSATQTGTTATTPTQAKTPSAQQAEFENALDINTYIPSSTTETEDNNKPKKNITMGGMFEFALPNLAVQSGEKLYNTKQFVNTYTKNADPITVALQKVELNNNKKVTDNTSYGWRYYLDNLLLASPIEENVYVGTTNNVLSIDYNNKTYKANIVISVIQYRVGYNSNEELAFKQGTWLRNKTIGGTTYTAAELEESYIDWYKVADPQPSNATTLHYVRFNAINDETHDGTYTVGNYTNNNVVTFFKPMVPGKGDVGTPTIPDTPQGFTREDNDSTPSAPIYYEKLDWTKHTFKYKTTVTDVIYYIVPMEELNSQETDLFSVINSKGTTDNITDKLVCMKYRLFFKENKSGNENINTIFYNPLVEPIKGKGESAVPLCTPINSDGTSQDDGTTKTFKLYAGVSGIGQITTTGISNICFVVPNVQVTLDTKTSPQSSDIIAPIFQNNDKTYLHPSTEKVENVLGKYNNYIWCSGQIVSIAEPQTKQIGPQTRLDHYLVNKERCAPGCGRMLPQTPNQIAGTKWLLPLTDTCKVDSAKQYEFYTQKSNGAKINTLSTNLRDTDFQKISIGDVSLRYILEKDNGWYINDRRIVTEAVNTDGITYSKYTDDGYPVNNGGASTENNGQGSVVTPGGGGKPQG